MKPENTPPTRQGTGTHRRDHPEKTVGDQDIPRENRELAGVDEGVTEGSLPEGQTAPKTSRLEDRPSRGVNRGLHR
jgi:hypothetical protein